MHSGYLALRGLGHSPSSILHVVKISATYTGMLVLGLGLGFSLVLGLEISRPRTISRTSKM